MPSLCKTQTAYSTEVGKLHSMLSYYDLQVLFITFFSEANTC
jgi:hypothetical protein